MLVPAELERSLNVPVSGVARTSPPAVERRSPTLCRKPPGRADTELVAVPHLTVTPTLLASIFQGLANCAVRFFVIMWLQGVRGLTPLHASLLLVGGVDGFFPANSAVVIKTVYGDQSGIASGLLKAFANVGMVFSFAVAILVADRSIPVDRVYGAGGYFVGYPGWQVRPVDARRRSVVAVVRNWTCTWTWIVVRRLPTGTVWALFGWPVTEDWQGWDWIRRR